MSEEKKQETVLAIDKHKWLYSFEIKNPAGELQRFYLLKPGRIVRQDGEIEYAKQLAFFVKKGLLPRAAWNTILQNLGGTVSENELQEYAGWRAKRWENEIKLGKLNLKSDLTDKDQKEKDKLADLDAELREKIQAFELNQIYVFENTAEAKARNQTILWWLTTLAHRTVGDSIEKFFEGDTFEEKLDFYDGFDAETEEGEYLIKVAQKFNYFVTLWFLNRVSTYEQFAEIDDDKKLDGDVVDLGKIVDIEPTPTPNTEVTVAEVVSPENAPV